MMSAITVPQAGGAEQLCLQSISVPQPTANEVLVKVAAAGVNRADILQRQGHYPPPAGTSPLLGLETSGEIVALGDKVAHWQIGDQVCALLPGGGYAEYAVAESALCLPIPAGINLIDAAGLPEAAFTTYANLVATAKVKTGDWVLIQGGSSGIGSFAIQLMKALGAHVITTVSSAVKTEFCRQLGADYVINYQTEDFVAATLAATQGRGVDIILDIIGQAYFAQHLAILANGGRLVTIATPSGKTVNIDLLQIMQKQQVITGSTLRGRSLAEKAILAQNVQQIIWPLLATGQIKPLTDQVFPLNNAVGAHQRMESSQHMGKILLSTMPAL